MRKLSIDSTPEKCPKVFHSDTGEARAAIRLYGLGVERVRQQGLLSLSPFAPLHEIHVDHRTGPSSVSIRNLLRGDEPIANHSVRIFHWSEDIPNSSSLFLPGINPLALDADADGYYNRDLLSIFEPMTVVKALTVDGSGGKLDLTQDFPKPCFWYYVENEFVCAPDGITLESVKIQKPNGTHRMLENTFLRVQRENLTNWFLRIYQADKTNAPTRRPITENYYAQINESDLSTADKEDLGLAMFGKHIYEALEARRNAILTAVRRRQRA